MRTRLLVVGIVTVLAAAVAVGIFGVGRSSPRAVAGTPPLNSVTVSGTGTVQGVPDTLTASFDVHVTRVSVQSALNAEAASTNRVIAALKKAGVPAADIQTASLSLNPHMNSKNVTTGYDADESVIAQITPISKAGSTISAAATASGNDVSVEGLSFDVANDHDLLAQARSAAFADAKDTAQQYAGLADRSLGAVETISETVNQPDQPEVFAGTGLSLGKSAAPVPISPGQQPITVTVTVVWALS